MKILVEIDVSSKKRVAKQEHFVACLVLLTEVTMESTVMNATVWSQKYRVHSGSNPR
jgi:hypothetical protein